MKELNRAEIWELLIEAEMNTRYFGVVSDFCRWWNTFAKLTLILASVSSLAAIMAQSKYQLVLAWLSFAAAMFEVVIKPVADWEKVANQAREWRHEWIDIREILKGLWKTAYRLEQHEILNGEKAMKRIVALEKAKGYVPKIQWLMDCIAKRAAKRYAASALLANRG